MSPFASFRKGTSKLTAAAEAREEAAFEAKSAEFRKEVGLRDLVLHQVVYVVSTIWVGTRVPLWLRLAALSGFGVTLLHVVLSIFPIIDVSSWLTFAVKISSVVVGLNLVGVALHISAARRRRVSGEQVAPAVA